MAAMSPTSAPVVSPMPSQNEADAAGRMSARSLANTIIEGHQKALSARRAHDLLWEKYLLHIDGSGDFQWADILDGSRVEIPRLVSGYRKTENLLRIIVDNAVAHHTTIDLMFFAGSAPDRQARDKALLDTLWINDLAHKQDFNGIFAEALYMAMATGFCPVHAYWREDATMDWTEGISYGRDEAVPQAVELQQGMIDVWVGNPLATVHDISAKRGSVRWASYERLLPADLVRETFAHIPGVDTLEGSSKIPSASTFQQIARKWMMGGLGLHGSPVINERRGDEELITVICRETAPYADSRYGAAGRLQIVAVPGDIDLRRQSKTIAGGLLLADQPLPGGDWSWENFYSHHRGNSIEGKPWIADIDELQVSLNIARSKRWEYIQKMIDAPIVTPGGAIAEDFTNLDGYSLLELEPSLATWRPKVMEWPQGALQALDKEIDELRSAMYTMGGYQAASRGESLGSRTAAKTIMALQTADSSIHGPVNARFQRSACNFAGRCHSQFKMYGDVPWLVSMTGDDVAYLAAPYIDATQLSDTPPKYRLVNAFGSSPEGRAQEVLTLIGTRGADGQPFMSTEEGRRQYPDQSIFDTAGDPTHVKRRRAKTIAAGMHQLAVDLRRETGFTETAPNHPWIAQAAQQIFMAAEGKWPRLRDDLLDAHVSAYSEITQDETADPIARAAVSLRLDQYYAWQAQMAQIPVAGGQPGAPVGSPPPGGQAADKQAVAAEMQGGAEAEMRTQ